MSTITERGNGAVDENGPAPAIAILRTYWKQLAALLPSHVRPQAYYAAVHAALYRNPQLLEFANKNPESLIFALYDSARQGLEPGTPQYYLTPRPNKNAKMGVEVLGMRGYQGEIELIYRAGAAANVVVSVVREKEPFRFQRGLMDYPEHVIDWSTRKKQRGEIYLVYGYCLMRDGSYSQVVVLDEDDIERAKRASGTANKQGSRTFWNDPDDVEAMWLKTAVHRLQKYVPTSAEYVRVNAEVTANAKASASVVRDTRAAEQISGPQDAQRQLEAASDTPPPAASGAAAGQEDRAEVEASAPDPGDRGVEAAGELDLSKFAQPPAPEDGAEQPVDDDPGERTGPAPVAEGETVEMVTEFSAPTARGDDPPVTEPQKKAIGSILGRAKFGGDEQRFPIVSWMVARQTPVGSFDQLSKPEASAVMNLLSDWTDRKVLAAQLAAVLDAALDGYGRPDDGTELPEVGTKAWHDAGHPTRTAGGRVQTVPALMNGDCGICEQA